MSVIPALLGASLLAMCGLLACDVADEDAGLPRAADKPAPDPIQTVADSSADAAALPSADAGYAGSYEAAAPDANEASVAPAYVLTPDTVLDPARHLMWQRNEPPGFFEGVPTDYCSGLDLGGFDDWRTATVDELTSLLVPQEECPLLDHEAFPKALCDWYMSGEILNGDIYNPKMVDFATGVTKQLVDVGSNVAYSARCVRTSP